MRIEVYRNGELAAVFDYDALPSYYGAAGRRVKALVAAPHPVHNLWTGETLSAPPLDRPDWWASHILSAGLRDRGFEVTFSTALAAAEQAEPTAEPRHNPAPEREARAPRTHPRFP